MDWVKYIIIIVLLISVAGIAISCYLLYSKKHKRKNENALLKHDNKSETSDDLVITDGHDVALNIADIQELILQDNSGNRLSFQRPETDLSTKRYQEILSDGMKVGGHIAQGALPVLGQAHTIAELQKLAPNGLFTATANKAVLSHFANGTYTTMVRDSANHLQSHAGFKEIGELSKINPAVALGVGMQAMAAISGQYFLTQINGKLEEMNKFLEDLINMHHDANIGRLQNAQRRLSEISNRTIADEADIYEIRELRNRIGEVYNEYEIRLKREYDQSVNFKSNKWCVKKRVSSYNDLLAKLNFTMRISAEADKLRLHSEVAELAVRLKVDANDPMLPESYLQLKKNFDDSFVKKLRDTPEEITQPIIENGIKIVKGGKNFGLIDKNKQLQLISNKAKETVSLYSTSDKKELAEKMLEESDQPYEILLFVDNSEKQRVLIPADRVKQA